MEFAGMLFSILSVFWLHSCYLAFVEVLLSGILYTLVASFAGQLLFHFAAFSGYDLTDLFFFFWIPDAPSMILVLIIDHCYSMGVDAWIKLTK